MKNTKLRIGVTDIVFLAASLIFLLGIRFAFGPCGPKEDGSWMLCHWAGNVLMGLAAVLVVLAILHILSAQSAVKLGLSLGAIPVSVLAWLIPGKLIQMCMMQDMRCHTVMTPAVTLCAGVMIVIAVVDIIVQYRRGKA